MRFEKSCIYVILGAIMMGTLPIFVRELSVQGMNAIQITSLRLLTGFIYLSVFYLVLGKKPKLRNWKFIFLISVINTATILFYIKSIQVTKVATAALLLYMAPVYVVIFSFIIGEKISLKQLFAVVMGLIGLWFIISPNEISGDVFGVLSGIFYAFYFLVMKRARSEMDSLSITFAYLGISSIFLSPFALSPIKLNQIIWVLGLGLIPTAFAFTIFNHGIKGCGASNSSLSALVEPLTVSVIGYVFFGEVLSIRQVLGGILILTSIFVILEKK